MKLIQWESLHNIGSHPEYGQKRSILDTAPLTVNINVRRQLWELEDYEVTSVSKGKIWLNRRMKQ